MKKVISIQILLLGLIFCPYCLFSQGSPLAKGQVVDLRGNPISGVKVRISREGKRIAQGITDANGFYSIYYVSGNPVKITYLQTEYKESEIVNLMGISNHEINKVLLFSEGSQSPTTNFKEKLASGDLTQEEYDWLLRKDRKN